MARQTTTQSTFQKPRHDFPLVVHKGSGQWSKKINGRTFYFGKLDDPDAAEKRYLAEKTDRAAGRVPRTTQVTMGRVDVAFACNAFLTAKRRRVDSGEITERTWQELFKTCQTLTKAFGRDTINARHSIATQNHTRWQSSRSASTLHGQSHAVNHPG